MFYGGLSFHQGLKLRGGLILASWNPAKLLFLVAGPQTIAQPWSIDRQKGLLCSPLTKCLSSCQEIHLFLPRDTTHVLLGFRCAFIVGVIFFFFRVGAFKTFCAHDDVALSTNNHPADYFYWIDAIKNFFNFFYSLPGIFMTENCRVYSRLYVINMRA